MPHARSTPSAGTVARSRPARWLALVALALLAPAAAWVLLPADTTALQAGLASGDTPAPAAGSWLSGSRGGNDGPPAVGAPSRGQTDAGGQRRVAGDQAAAVQPSAASAGSAGAQAPGPAAQPVPAGQNVPVAPGGRAAGEATRAPADSAAGADNLFLTIVGDQTFTSWGRAGDRPPPVDGMTAADGGSATVSLDRVEDGSGSGSFDEPLLADTGGDVGDPLGEAPQVCPRTLPPGSNQATADALRSQYSCRYLSGCDVVTQQCTWFYQGKG